MPELRNEPHGESEPTEGVLPPVTNNDPVRADGARLIGLDQLGESGVKEVRTQELGVLAVGMADGKPFATSNVCRHQLGELGRGRVTEDGCLECPWHRARFDVSSGRMVEGPKGRIFGFKPYSEGVKAFGNVARLRTFPVEVRDGAIWLT